MKGSPLGPKKVRINVLWIYGIIAVMILGWNYFSNSKPTPASIYWNRARDMIAAGDVARIDVINRERAEVYIIPDSLHKYTSQDDFKKIPAAVDQPQFTFNIGSVETFRADLDKAQVDSGHVVALDWHNRHNVWGDILGALLPIVLIVAFWILIMRNMSRGGGGAGGIFSVGKARAQVFDKDAAPPVTFKDVAGLEEAKVEIMEVVDFLKKPEKYRELGGKIPKGILLVGPPGTGKTLLAKAVAGEANVPFLSMSGSDFVEMFVGVGASRVRDLFRQAKEKAPCIVFIDEIDSIGRARGKNTGYTTNDEKESTLNQLLTEMDGFGTNTGVIMLAATNRADILDKALLRAGRFDRQIEVGLPDIKEREEIFEVHLRGLKLVPGLDRSFLAKQTPGFSGADIANLCNEAALIAARNDKPYVDKNDFLNAIDRIVGGLERKNKIITPEEKRTIAYHEAGHATVSWILENANPLIKVTIIPRGKSLGAAWYLPEERQITTREQLMDQMASMLGGRASEEMVLGQISTGALNDLETATKMAYAMVTYYGMSAEVGNLSYYDSSGQSDFALTKPFSEKTAQQIDVQTRKMIDEAYAMAQQVLRTHRKGLDELAKLLLEKEVIFTDDLIAIFGKRKKDIERERREAEAATSQKAAAGSSAGAGAAPAAGIPVWITAKGTATEVTVQSAEPAPKRRAGRPAKTKTSTEPAAEVKPKLGRGRPKAAVVKVGAKGETPKPKVATSKRARKPAKTAKTGEPVKKAKTAKSSKKDETPRS